MKSKLIILFLLLATIQSVTFAQEIKKEIPLKYEATNEGKRQDTAIGKWMQRYEKASLLTVGENINVVETARNEYNVSVPKKNPGEPYVIQFKVRTAGGIKGEYRDSLT